MNEIHRRPTPQPGFDLARFARESEQKMLATEGKAEEAVEKPVVATIPPALDARLRECGARIALVRSELATGSLSREEAASMLRVELQALAASARGVDAGSLAGCLGDLGAMVEALGGIDDLGL